jgi:SAM-dependent methyltransferase
LASESNIEKASNRSRRERVKPTLFDFSYILTRNNLIVFKRFKNLLEKEKKVNILDVGCGFKPWAPLLEKENLFYVGIDLETTSSSDVIASAEKLPFHERVFDGLIYSEVLEHIEDLDRALEEMRRVAKRGALVFISTPFFFYEHLPPYDFRRLTQFALRRYFHKDKMIWMRFSNGIFANPFLMVNLVWEKTPLRKLPIASHLIYFLNNLSALLMELLCRSIIWTAGHLYRKESFVEKVVQNTYSFPFGYALLLRINE